MRWGNAARDDPVPATELIWLGTAAVMTAILLPRLIYRERQGSGTIGAESVAMLVVYGGAIAIQSCRASP